MALWSYRRRQPGNLVYASVGRLPVFRHGPGLEPGQTAAPAPSDRPLAAQEHRAGDSRFRPMTGMMLVYASMLAQQGTGIRYRTEHTKTEKQQGSPLNAGLHDCRLTMQRKGGMKNKKDLRRVFFFFSFFFLPTFSFRFWFTHGVFHGKAWVCTTRMNAHVREIEGRPGQGEGERVR